MNEPAPRTNQLLKIMADEPVPAQEPERALRRRDQVVARVTSMLQERHRARRRRRWIPAMAALAAALAVAVSVAGIRIARRPSETIVTVAAASPPARARAVEGTVLAARSGALLPLSVDGDTDLESGDELRTAAQGGATVALRSGVVVNMGSDTHVSMGVVQPENAPGRDHVVLTRGRVDVTVSPLQGGRSFAVRTPDAEVVVHGTRFSVFVLPSGEGAPMFTRVQVTEGRVSVVHAGIERALGRGDTWSSAEASARASAPEEPSLPPSAASSEATTTEEAPDTTGPVRSAPRPEHSSLADENRLFQAAMEAKRAGDDRKVVGILDTLLSKYPHATLAPEARVERFRALKRLGREADAAREARRYLAENPDGFARDEARDTVLDPAPSTSHPKP